MLPSSVIAFSMEEDVRAVVSADNGEYQAIIGVPGEKAVLIPITLLAHILDSIDDQCAKMNIAIHEAQGKTKH